jgi:hypothetical protein
MAIKKWHQLFQAPFKSTALESKNMHNPLKRWCYAVNAAKLLS